MENDGKELGLEERSYTSVADPCAFHLFIRDKRQFPATDLAAARGERGQGKKNLIIRIYPWIGNFRVTREIAFIPSWFRERYVVSLSTNLPSPLSFRERNQEKKREMS